MSGAGVVVGWTVGPGTSWGASYRLKWSYDSDEYYTGVASVNRDTFVLYATKPAALAAGRAFGWDKPVARRVVRKETGR